jgi:hypothetical protein
MREIYEFRIDEEFAGMLFGPDEGRALGLIRPVKIPSTDVRVAEIGRLQTELQPLHVDVEHLHPEQRAARDSSRSSELRAPRDAFVAAADT